MTSVTCESGYGYDWCEYCPLLKFCNDPKQTAHYMVNFDEEKFMASVDKVQNKFPNALKLLEDE